MALQRRRGRGRRGEDGQRYGQPQPRRPAVRRPAGGPLRQGGGERYCRLVQQSFLLLDVLFVSLIHSVYMLW